MNNWKAIALVFLILLTCFTPACYAVIHKASMPVYAVVSGEDEAIQAVLSIEIEPGDGSIYTRVGPLVGTSTQNTEKISVALAKNYFDRVDDYDYKFAIESDASIVDGPSAGAAMALLLVSMLQEKDLGDNVSVTGTINPDGSVGPVGGVFPKARKASDQGVNLFLIPSGEALQTYRIDNKIMTVDLTQYGWHEWGTKIIEVETLDDLLHYAFTNVQDINVEQIASEKDPLFIPEAIQLNKKLLVMKDFTAEYLEEAENRVNSAKGSLANTILSDSAIENTLYSSIAQAEQTLDEARGLYDQNYLYSAANYAFLTVINASMVEDISNDPSLLETGSMAFSKKLGKLEKKAKELERELNSVVPKEMVEWDIAAKQRLAWAKLKILKIKESQEIEMGGLEGIVVAVNNLREYEFAKAWVEIAESFNDFSAKSREFVNISELFEEEAEENIIKAENSLTALSVEDIEDISRRLQGAYIERTNGWFLAAALDGASAEYLAEAEEEIQGKNLDELLALIEEKIRNLNAKIAESGGEFVWTQMYLDHGNYFFKAAKFYQENESIVKANNNAKSSVSLVMFAEGIFGVMNTAYEEIEGLETIIIEGGEEIPGGSEGEGEEEIGQNIIFIPSLNALLLAILVLLVVIFLVLLAYFFKTRTLSFREISSEASAWKKIEEVKKIEEKIDKALMEGKISEKKHNELMKKYKEKEKELLKKRGKKSLDLIELDELEAELLGKQRLLRRIQRQYNLRKLMRKLFLEEKKKTESEIFSVKERIKTKKLALEADEEEIKKVKVRKPEMKKEKKKEIKRRKKTVKKK